ncbi:hypothetical protein FRC18_003288 [Serendipita sp. 400]|nr:hypothetical protein FRC18_003288 [Serendipita sp. 400]
MIGEGGFSRVYKGYYTPLEKTVAIKVVARVGLQRAGLDWLWSERDIGTLIHVSQTYSNDPYHRLSPVSPIIGSFVTDTHFVFVMDWAAGDLGSLELPVPEDVARVYLAQITLGLQSLHSLGCVHRDLKPKNVLLDLSGNALIADFGLAELTKPTVSMSLSSNGLLQKPRASLLRKPRVVKKVYTRVVRLIPSLGSIVKKGKSIFPFKVKSKSRSTNRFGARTPTPQLIRATSKRRHHIVGTCGYIPPEAYQEGIQDEKGDIFALGMIMLVLLTGMDPYRIDADSAWKTIRMIKIGQIEVDSQLSPAAVEALEGLLHYDPMKRLTLDQYRRSAFFTNCNFDWGAVTNRQASVSIPLPQHILENATATNVNMEIENYPTLRYTLEADHVRQEKKNRRGVLSPLSHDPSSIVRIPPERVKQFYYDGM